MKNNITEYDKELLINLINLLIRKGVTEKRIYAFFDRSDVTKNENKHLVSIYHELYNSNLIDINKMKKNESIKK